MDGVLKVGGGGDLGPVLVPVLLPAPCGSKVETRQYIAGNTNSEAVRQTPALAPFSGANMDMILLLDFFSSGTDGSGREL